MLSYLKCLFNSSYILAIPTTVQYKPLFLSVDRSNPTHFNALVIIAGEKLITFSSEGTRHYSLPEGLQGAQSNATDTTTTIDFKINSLAMKLFYQCKVENIILTSWGNVPIAKTVMVRTTFYCLRATSRIRARSHKTDLQKMHT